MSPPASRYAGPERRQEITDARLDLLEHQMAGMSVVMRDAVSDGMRQALTDPEVLKAVWEAAMKQGQVGMHQRVGRWVFSRWTAIFAIVVLVANFIGWPAALKLFWGIAKGDS